MDPDLLSKADRGDGFVFADGDATCVEEMEGLLTYLRGLAEVQVKQ